MHSVIPSRTAILGLARLKRAFRIVPVMAVVSLLTVTACSPTDDGDANNTGGTSHLDEIIENDELRVALVDQAGYAQRDPSTDEWSGLEYDVAKALADYMGVELTPVETTWDNAVAEVQSDRADIVMPGLIASPERASSVWFTRPYKLEGETFVIRKEDADRFSDAQDFNDPDVTIGLEVGSASNQAAERFAPEAELDETKGNTRFQQLEAGRVDAVAISFNSASLFVDSNDWSALFSDTPYAGSPMVIGVAQGDEHLVRFLDSTLSYMIAQGIMEQLAIQNDQEESAITKIEGQE